MILLIYRITFFKWYTISNFSIFGGFKIFSPETLNFVCFCYISQINTFLTIDVYVPLTLTLGISTNNVNAERLRYIEYIQTLPITVT